MLAKTKAWKSDILNYLSDMRNTCKTQFQKKNKYLTFKKNYCKRYYKLQFTHTCSWMYVLRPDGMDIFNGFNIDGGSD